MNIKLVGWHVMRNVNIFSAYFRQKCLGLLRIKEEMIYFQSFWKQRNNFFKTQDCISGKTHSFSFTKNVCSKKKKKTDVHYTIPLVRTMHTSMQTLCLQLFCGTVIYFEFRLIDKQVKNWFSVGKFGLTYPITTILYIKRTIHHNF